ncbi:MAG: hypothetical protein AAF961_12825, partial [Planctomycetota bacterium]
TKYFDDVGGFSFVLGVGAGDDPLYSQMLIGMRTSDAAEFVAKYRRYYEELDDVVGDVSTGLFSDIQVEQHDINGVEGLKIRMPISGQQFGFAPNPAELDVMMEKMYGPDPVTLYVAAASDNLVLMAYTDDKLLADAIRNEANFAEQLAGNQQIDRTSASLPKDAYAIGYWDVGGTMQFVKRVVRVMTDRDSGNRLPDFPDAPPVGWAMTVQPGAMSFDTVVPAATLQAGGRFARAAMER